MYILNKQSGKHWFVVCFLFFELTTYAHYACILSACTRVRSYLYQRAILHSSGKGQFKEQQTSSIYKRKYTRSSRTRIYAYIYICIYIYIFGMYRNTYPQHEQQVNHNRNDTRSHIKTSDINAAVVTNYVISKNPCFSLHQSFFFTLQEKHTLFSFRPIGEIRSHCGPNVHFSCKYPARRASNGWVGKKADQHVM